MTKAPDLLTRILAKAYVRPPDPNKALYRIWQTPSGYWRVAADDPELSTEGTFEQISGDNLLHELLHAMTDKEVDRFARAINKKPAPIF